MSETKQSGGGLRWWMMGVFGFVPLGLIVLTRCSVNDGGLRNVLTMMELLLLGLLLTIWYLFCSRLPWRWRMGLLAVEISFGAGFCATVRVAGVYGNLIPQLRWRWSRPADFGLPGAMPGGTPATVGVQAVDLAYTGPGDFPGFLGPTGRGTVEGLQLGKDWSKHPPQLVWRQSIGAGWSSFAVVGKFAVTQEQRGRFEQVTCYDLRDGRLCWVHEDQARFTETAGGDGPRATPTIADGKIYAMGATGLLHCLEAADGSVIWSRNILADHGQKNLTWGKSCSPLVLDNCVVVSLGDSSAASLAAYDRRTGTPLWTAGHDTASYATPVATTLAGRRQIVVVNAHSVAGHDAGDGRLLWEYSWPGKTAKCSQPVPLGPDRVFIATGYGIGCAMLQINAGPDGSMAVKELWRSRFMNTRFTNVVMRQGMVYGLDDGVLECISLATGQLKWRGMRYGHGQVMLVGDVLLVMAESGQMAIVDAAPDEFREFSRMEALTGKTWNNPALSGGYLLIRNAQEAACYSLNREQ